MNTTSRELITREHRVSRAKRRMRRSARDRERRHDRDDSHGWLGVALDNPLATTAVVFGVLSIVGPARAIRLAGRAAALLATTKGLSTPNR